MIRKFLLIALLLAVAAHAIATPVIARQETWTGSVVQRDGVLYVANPDRPLWAEQEPHSLRFELEQVFGADAEPVEATLGRVVDLTVDNNKQVFVLDRQSSRIVAFRPDGSVLWRSGGRGEGPGELYRPTSIASNGDTLFVANLGGNRLERLSVGGVYRDGHALADYGVRGATIAGMLSRSTLVLRSASYDAAGALVTVVEWGSTSFEVTAQFLVIVADSAAAQGATATVPVRAVNSAILAGEIDSYDLRFFDATGRLTRVVSRNASPLVGFVRATGPSSWLWPPLVLRSGHLISYSTWNVAGNHWQSAVDLFGPDGRFLYSREWDGPEWPDLGRPNTVDSDDRLYTIRQDPFPQVRRYRVVIDEPRGGPQRLIR